MRIFALVILIAFCFLTDINCKPSEAPEIKQYGCRKDGYCFSRCNIFSTDYPLKWCYTTKSGRSLDLAWVKCEEDSHCEREWKCAGLCST